MICCRYRFFSLFRLSPAFTIFFCLSVCVCVSACLPLTHNTHKHTIYFNQFRIVLCSRAFFCCIRFCIYINICFSSQKFICSLPFSFCRSHSVSCFLSLNILTLCVVLFVICANPIKMALFGFIFKRNAERKNDVLRAALSSIFNIKINEFELFYRRPSFVVKKEKENRGRPQWNLRKN